MFIHKVVSYGGAWDRLQSDFPEVVQDLQAAFSQITISNIEKADLSGEIPSFAANERSFIFLQTQAFIRIALGKLGWERSYKYRGNTKTRMALLGMTKQNQVSVNIFTMQEQINRWLYTVGPLAIVAGVTKIPIAVLIEKSSAELMNPVRAGSLRESFERTCEELLALAPLSHAYPFVIIGLGLNEVDAELVEIPSARNIDEGSVVINRAIEFPPEYHQAGIGILSYFGEVLRTKHPNSKAKVKIEQEGLLVRLVVESKNGDREIIEKALRDYEQVVCGDANPDILFDSKAKIVELRTELRFAQARIESQSEIMQLQRDEIFSLRNVIGNGLSKPNFNITVSPQISVSSSSICAVRNDIADLIDMVEVLADKATDDPALQIRLLDLCESIDSINDENDVEAVKNSSALSKMRSFIDEASATGSAVNDFLDKVSNGVDIIQKLASKYNQIASWCGIPQVPSIFLGKNS